MNKVILKGNVGKDPQVNRFDNGQVAKFSLATSESYTDKKGEKITDTQWHNIVFWGKVVDPIEKYVHKGDQLIVEGKIVYRSWDDKEGVTHYGTEVVCNNFEFCGSKDKPDNNEGKYQKGDKVDMKAISDPAELDPSYVPDPPF